MGKTILILGNGFDLAHSLPTRYSDFMEFCHKVEYIWSFSDTFYAINDFHNKHISSWNIDESIRNAIDDAFKNRVVKHTEREYIVTTDNLELTEIHSMLDNNVWYSYFSKLLRDKKMRGENWIDFESEIRLIIEEVDRKTSTLSDKWNDIVPSFKDPKLSIFATCFHNCVTKTNKYDEENKFNDITIKDFRKETYSALDQLIRALELYLSAFVEKIELKSKISEIEN